MTKIFFFLKIAHLYYLENVKRYRTGDIRNNNNGTLLCAFVITNTFFELKNIYKYRREVISRREKLIIIDYILVRNDNRRQTILDT